MVARDWLAGLLWRDSSSAQALYNLRRNLTDLRDALGPEAHRLQTPTSRTLRLDLAGADVDVLRFDAAIAAGDGPSLESAVHLYRGPLLMECCEEWIMPERTAREQAYLGALETLAREAQARGDREAERRYLRRALGVDPLREGAQQAVMEVLAAQGDPSAALLVYREYRQLLQRQASTAPGPEITALFAQLRARARSHERRLSSSPSRTRGKAPEGTAAPGTLWVRALAGRHEDHAHRCFASRLPQPVSSFVGRDQEVREIAARLATARLVTLTGPGGVGKTRLAIQVAEAIADDHAGTQRSWVGVWFVDLTRLSEPALVPQAIASVLGVQEQPDRPLMERLAEFLRARQLLLVLDNCEHLLTACAELVEALLSRSPALRVLATSRQSLGVAGEVAWQLPGLSVPPAPATALSTPEALLQFEAVRLFVERARGAAPSISLTARRARSVGEVCRRLDGIPLAIELAAARLKALSAEEIAARLDDAFRLLTSGSRTAPPRQQTLRATMDWSYELLSEPERLLLQRLSVFAGTWTLAAAEAICSDFGFGIWDSGLAAEASDPPTCPPLTLSDPIQNPNAQRAPEIQNAEVLDLLAQLVDQSLVIVETTEDGQPVSPMVGEAGTRYRLLETVRQYARERLQEAPRGERRGETERVGERHARFYLELAERAAPYLAGPDLVTWLVRLEEERDSLRAALEWSLQHAPEVALRLAAALAGFWEERWYMAEGRQWLGAALARAGPARRSPAGAAALEGACALAILQDDRAAAQALLEEYRTIRQESGDRAGMAASLAHLAHAMLLRVDYPAARALYEESLAIQKERGDPAGIATVLTGLGHLARCEKAYATARSLHEESLAIRREMGDSMGMGRSLSGLGDAARGLGDIAAARRHYEAALEIWRELGDGAGVAGALAEISDLARLQGDYAEARRLREESLALWRAAGARVAVLHSLGALGHLAREQGDYREAWDYYAASLQLRQEAGDRYTIVQALEDFAELAACEQQWWRLARLLGAAQALREAIIKPLRPPKRAGYEELLAEARAALPEAAVTAAWEEGWALIQGRGGHVEQAIAFALQETSPPPVPPMVTGSTS
jgi:predicted ATPase/DNA-binding SARP family transcriptional activator